MGGNECLDIIILVTGTSRAVESHTRGAGESWLGIYPFRPESLMFDNLISSPQHEVSLSLSGKSDCGMGIYSSRERRKLGIIMKRDRGELGLGTYFV